MRAQQRVAQQLAAVHARLSAPQQATLRARSREAFAAPFSRSCLVRLANWVLPLCCTSNASGGGDGGGGGGPGERAGGAEADHGLVADVIQALEALLSAKGGGSTPLHPAAAVFAHLRRPGAPSHCFVTICTKLAGSGQAVDGAERSDGTGDGGGGRLQRGQGSGEGLGVALGVMGSVMHDMLAEQEQGGAGGDLMAALRASVHGGGEGAGGGGGEEGLAAALEGLVDKMQGMLEEDPRGGLVDAFAGLGRTL